VKKPFVVAVIPFVAGIALLGCGIVANEPSPAKTGEARPGPTAEPAAPEEISEDAGTAARTPPDDLPAGLGCLRRAYGEFIERVDGAPATGLTIVMKSGARIPWDDGEPKSFEEKLARADLEDQMSIPYPAAWSDTPPGPDDDPGRIRAGALFDAIYGATPGEVKGRLVDVSWLASRGGGEVRFNGAGGAAAALGRVGDRLEAALPDELLRYVIPTGGTFNWRPIAGTDRRSAHSHGIAIDVGVGRSDYWRWSAGRGAIVHRNRIPREVVELFEREGFIWGGKWYHYDTMHFEYRPELLDPACAR
jgi:hypothetical protein